MQHTTREKIMSAARKYFSQEGYSGTSLEKIAGEVGIKKSSLYYFFKNKDALYAAMTEHAYESILKNLERYSSQALERNYSLARVIDDLLRPCLSQGTHIHVMVLKMLHSKAHARAQQEYMRRIGQCVIELMHAYKVANPEIAADILISMMYAYNVRSSNKCPVIPTKKFSNYLASAFLAAPNINKKK